MSDNIRQLNSDICLSIQCTVMLVKWMKIWLHPYRNLEKGKILVTFTENCRCSFLMLHQNLTSGSFFFFKKDFFFFFLMWTIFLKVFIEFVTTLLLFYVLVFWPQGMWDLSSQTRDRTRTPCIGRQSPNLWTSREVPTSGSFLKISCNVESETKLIIHTVTLKFVFYILNDPFTHAWIILKILVP